MEIKHPDNVILSERKEKEVPMGKVQKSYLFVVAYVVLLALVLTIILKLGASSEGKTEKIAFLTTGDHSDTGWSAINYQGIRAACDNLGVELLAMFEVEEFNGSCPKAVESFIEQGAGMVVLSSHGYSEEMKGLLENYPETVFYGAGADYDAPNMTAYSSRLYQARYLSGIVAGKQTENGKIGFVAANQENTVYRGINAFALGVRRVNPDAEVIVAWTGSLDDKDRETALAKALIEKEGVDVITYHQNRAYVIDVAEEYGINSIGYYQPVENASEHYLTCAMCDWEPIYERIIREYLRGQGNSVDSDWLGVESDVIRLTEYSPLVSQETRDEVEKAKEEMLFGQDVFSGVIYDNEGKERCGFGEAMSDETLLYRMDWLAEGVRVYEE